eukprot:scaffold65295_cov71-Cyclotella_meneghiniana.AAC.8
MPSRKRAKGKARREKNRAVEEVIISFQEPSTNVSSCNHFLKPGQKFDQKAADFQICATFIEKVQVQARRNHNSAAWWPGGECGISRREWRYKVARPDC